MEENQSVRMDELPSKISFLRFLFELGGAMEVGSSGEWRKKEWEKEEDEAGWVGLY